MSATVLKRIAAAAVLAVTIAGCGDNHVGHPFAIDDEGNLVILDGDPRIVQVEENFDSHLNTLGLRREELDARTGLTAMATWFEQERLDEIIPIEGGGDFLTIRWGTYGDVNPRFVYSIERFFVVADLLDDDSFYGLEITLTYEPGERIPAGNGVLSCTRTDRDECLSTIAKHPATIYAQTATPATIEIDLGNRG